MSKKLIVSVVVCLFTTGCSSVAVSTSHTPSTFPVNNEIKAWDQHVSDVTKDWAVFESTQKGITFKYPTHFYDEICPNNNELKVLETEDTVFLVPAETLERAADGKIDCNKKHSTKVQDIPKESDTYSTIFKFLTIYTKKVSSLKDIEKFYQQVDPSFKHCVLADTSFEFKEGDDILEYILFSAEENIQDVELSTELFMHCGFNVGKYNKSKGIVAIYHGKLNGGWLYTDKNTSVDSELENTIKFL